MFHSLTLQDFYNLLRIYSCLYYCYSYIPKDCDQGNYEFPSALPTRDCKKGPESECCLHSNGKTFKR